MFNGLSYSLRNIKKGIYGHYFQYLYFFAVTFIVIIHFAKKQMNTFRSKG